MGLPWLTRCFRDYHTKEHDSSRHHRDEPRDYHRLAENRRSSSLDDQWGTSSTFRDTKYNDSHQHFNHTNTNKLGHKDSQTKESQQFNHTNTNRGREGQGDRYNHNNPKDKDNSYSHTNTNKESGLGGNREREREREGLYTNKESGWNTRDREGQLYTTNYSSSNRERERDRDRDRDRGRDRDRDVGLNSSKPTLTGGQQHGSYKDHTSSIQQPNNGNNKDTHRYYSNSTDNRDRDRDYERRDNERVTTTTYQSQQQPQKHVGSGGGSDGGYPRGQYTKGQDQYHVMGRPNSDKRKSLEREREREKAHREDRYHGDWDNKNVVGSGRRDSSLERSQPQSYRFGAYREDREYFTKDQDDSYDERYLSISPPPLFAHNLQAKEPFQPDFFLL